ncbi:MAG TPA: TetR/AcrR family transcriptional regulator C-terminal domain-containing protein [Pseudonocardiaceae bacterium]|jgi:DNA-binding transcriptional regulator YhcF (GntR family)|nr:TetR/AcrR family transcriptional regulator C-terminal domain-containing protein [Pseudonocardiaceae bacterium]
MDSEAPYRRIAAEIRDRITRGELRPGDRVPSTRQITQKWGVAMATATKVIAVLRDEGIVEARPGAGTVVTTVTAASAGPVPRAVPRTVELTRDRIVRAAIAVADAEGLANVSMRRVATDLDVATMSLYRHVPGKDELLEFMADAVFGEQRLPATAPPGWRARLDVAAHLAWSIFRQHPWAAEVVSLTRPQAIPNLLHYAEWVLAALRDLGLDVDDMMQAHITLFGHVRGTALSLSAEVDAQRDTGMTNEEWIESQDTGMDEVFGSAEFPMLGHIAEVGFDFDLDRIFEFGLQRLLDGLAARFEPGTSPARPPAR